MAEKAQFIKRKKLIVVSVFAAVFFFGLVWVAIIPGKNIAPDELQHSQVVNYIVKNHKIPVFDLKNDLYFSPDLGSGVYYLMTYNPPLPYLPYLIMNRSGSNSAEKNNLLPMRLISSLFIGLFAVFLFLSLLIFWSEKLWPAVTISLFLSLIPQVIFSAGYVNIEPFSLFISALSFYFFARIYNGKNNSLTNYLYFGLVLGILALAKPNYLALFFFFGLLVLIKLLFSKLTAKGKFSRFVLAIVAILSVDGWWWLRNIKLYHDPIVINYIAKKIPLLAPDWFSPPAKFGFNTISILWRPDFARLAFLGFFANLGTADVLLHWGYYLVFFLIIVGLICWSLFSKGENQRQEIGITIFTLGLFLVNLLIFSHKNLEDFSPQGRHFFPMIIPLAWIIYLGAKKIGNKMVHLTIIFFSLYASVSALLTLYLKYRLESKVSFHQNLVAFRLLPTMIYFLLFLFFTLLVILTSFKTNAKSEN